MDGWGPVRRGRFLMAAGVLFLCSTCVSYQELIYLIQGRDTEAEITRDFEERRPRGGTTRVVEFKFREPNGTQRHGRETVPSNWQAPPNGKVYVRYTPGENGDSRFVGNIPWLAVGFFALTVGAIVVGFVMLLI